jgi:hypothetical protein
MYNLDQKNRKLSNLVNTSANTDNDQGVQLNTESNQLNKETDLYMKVCQEFIQMKHNYDRVKAAQATLLNMAMEQSSLDNLIKASINPT